MRRYDVLKTVFETNGGAAPKFISEKLRTALPNIYAYLTLLEQEGLVQKAPSGKYEANTTNEKLPLIMALAAMAPAKFHLLISPQFKAILQKLCKDARVSKKEFPPAQIRRLEAIAIPNRIVLRLSKRPSIYCLKINESLVQQLLEYHDLKPAFGLDEFQAEVDKASPGRAPGTTKQAASEPEVIKLCDEYYAKGEDIALFSKSKSFVPDERISELLKKAESVEKEYQLYLNGLPEHVRASIIDNWEKKYIYNTNSIEGNTMSEKEVSEFLKSGKSPRGDISKREMYETNNMRHSLQYLKLKLKEDISEELLQELHFMVQKDIDESPGKYKNFYNYVKPRNPTTPPQHVRERIRMLVDWYKQNRSSIHPFVLASIFHMQFEMIHPFADGNGRVGRLLMNHILEQNSKLPLTILVKTRQNYYRALENASIPQFMLYTLTSFIEEYAR